MADLNSITSFKEKLLELILSDQICVDLIAGKHISTLPAKNLRYTNVFPFAREPDITSDAKTFVCFDINADATMTDSFLQYEVEVWVFCHNSLAMVQGEGVRIDLISARICDLLKQHPDFGIGKVNLKASYTFSPAFDYIGRINTFSPYDFVRRK